MQAIDKRSKQLDSNQLLTPSLKAALLIPQTPSLPKKLLHRSEAGASDIPISQHIAQRHIRDTVLFLQV
jgi:hypothetical protein